MGIYEAHNNVMCQQTSPVGIDLQDDFNQTKEGRRREKKNLGATAP